MKKGFSLVLSILFLCSCSNNPSKQVSEIISSNSNPVTSENVDVSGEAISSISSSSSSSKTELEFTGAKMDNVTVTYDGQPHKIEPTGYPEGTKITYSGQNEFTDAGNYTIGALLTKDGYKDLFLTATLTINVADMENVVFEDKTVLYDGQAHSLEPKNMPEGSRVSYRRLDGGNGTNTFTEVGSYSIEARIIHHNYNEKKLTATLTIRSYSSLYGVDTSKQAFVFDNELVWNDVFGEILKSNYTLKMYSGTRQSEEEDYLLKDSESYTKVVCDGKESLIESYSPTDGFYKYALFMIKDNDAIRYEADFTRDEIYFNSKMPKEAMDETVLKYYPARAFVGLQEVNGMVAPGVDLDDFYGNVGTFTVKDNRLIIKHEHKRENGTYFYDVYEFSNVGNSKLDLPRSLLPSDKEIEKLSRVSKFYMYGVQYREALVSTWNSPTEFMAHTYLYYWQQLILEPGAHFVYPAIYDRKVERVVYTFYSETNVYNFNMSGYELNVCFDNQGNYQGEYAKWGTVTDRTSNFASHGGVVHYYDEWATN